MRHVAALLVTSAMLAVCAARADVTGSWRVGFSNYPGGPIGDFCRFDLVESADGQVEGWLGLCGLGTDGVFSGSVDSSGGVTLHIVAPDDVGCETYHINGSLTAAMDEIDGSYLCTHPLGGLGGDVQLTRCDPLTPGSCPETRGAGLAPRVHEIRACTPAPAVCQGAIGTKAKLTVRRDDPFHWKLTFKLPDISGVTLADLGDPTTVRDYVLCIYETVAGSAALVGMEPAWADTPCGAAPCWATTSTGLKYRNGTGRLGKLRNITAKVRSGIGKVLVKGGVTTVLARA